VHDTLSQRRLKKGSESMSTATEPEVLMLPLDQLEVADDTGLRKVKTDSEKYKQMLSSVKQRGIINAIPARRVVDTETGKTRIVLIDGLHRRTCAAEAGLKEVPVRILEADEAEVLELQIEANFHKVETKPAQFAKQLQRIMLEKDRTIEEQAKIMSVSPAWIKSRLDFLVFDEETQKLIDDGDIKISNAIALSVLAKHAPEQVKDWVQRAQEQSPDVFFNECMNAAKAAKLAKKGQKVTLTGPAQKLRGVGDIKKEFEHAQATAKANPNDLYLKGYADFAAWVLQQDPVSIAAWQKAEAERQAEKARKEEEKLAKKAQKEAGTA
jgi:ParB/RepB/Spo0J family partition protein